MAPPLPHRHGSETDDSRNESKPHVRMTGSPSVLIVDCDRESLDGLMAVMAGAGYRVTGVQSFEEGRRALDGSPDVLVTGIRLGAYNGLQLIIRGRALNPRLRAIVVTAHPDLVVRREAEQLHALYMVKPVDPARLLDQVAQAMGRSSAKIDD
jgi:DNA-binding NtrC family response regulator